MRYFEELQNQSKKAKIGKGNFLKGMKEAGFGADEILLATGRIKGVCYKKRKNDKRI